MFLRAFSTAAMALLILARGPAQADAVKGIALVQVEDPIQGTLPRIVRGHGTVQPETTQNESFQRDGQVSGIMVEVGDAVKKGDALLDFGASPAAIVAYEQAKTALRLAEGTRARTAAMVKLKLATNDALDAAEKAVSDAQLTKEMYEKQGSIRPSEILTAPFDGVVTAILVAKGDRIAAGTALMTLAESDKLRLSVGIEPTEIDKVKPGQPVNLISDLPGRKPFDGKVRGIGAAIDPKTRLLPVTVDIAAANALPGEKVTAGILVGEFKGWIVPRDALSIDKKSAYLFQIDEEHAQRVDVNVLSSVGETSVIAGDINPELKIVVAGGYQLGDGDAVRTAAAAGEARNER
jgi:RND family efflux transporter MFP subunit